MSKTAPIPDDVHTLIIDKQAELKRKHKITVKISDLIAMYVRHGIKKTERLLGLKTEDSSDDTSDTELNVREKERVDIDETDQSYVEDTKQNSISSQGLRIGNDVYDSNIVGEEAEAKA